MNAKVLRLAGVPIPAHKHIVIGLRSIYGIGQTRAQQICKAANVPFETKGKDIDPNQEEALRNEVKRFQEGGEIEGDLRRRIATFLKRLRDLKCYRGLRHMRGLPARGQRTRTNAQTRKRRRGGATKGRVGDKSKK